MNTSLPPDLLDNTHTPNGYLNPLSKKDKGDVTGNRSKTLVVGPENPTTKGSKKIVGAGEILDLNSDHSKTSQSYNTILSSGMTTSSPESRGAYSGKRISVNKR
jgi:hypothetical protein